MNQVLWFFGLPSSGKTTIARALRDHFQATGRSVVLLDGDDLCSDLGFSDADRSENLRRAAHIAQLLSRQGHTVICAFVAPKEHHRALLRQILGDNVFLVHIDCPLNVCMARDVKGLYAKAAARQMTGMTGSQDTFEPPVQADLVLQTGEDTLATTLATTLAALTSWTRGPA
jgi:adenylylsulfate kinase